MAKREIVHCDRMIATEKVYRVSNYKGEGITGIVYEGKCPVCKHKAFALKKYDQQNRLIGWYSEISKELRPVIVAAIREKGVKVIRPDKGSKKPTRGCPQVAEYTAKVNRPADNPALHRYLRLLAHLPEPEKTSEDQVFYSDYIAAERERWAIEQKRKALLLRHA